MLAQLHEKYPDDVRLVFRHYPLASHANSLTMAYGSEAAALQGKFFEMEQAIYSGQQEWALLPTSDAIDWLLAAAQTLGLDMGKFKTDLNSPAVKTRVNKNKSEGDRFGITQTPFLIINGHPYLPAGGYDLETLSSLVALSKHQASACPPMTIDPQKTYLATLKTEKGDVTLRLFADRAPAAVNSFVYLAGLKWYDGVSFYTVIPGSVAVTGDPSETGYGIPGYQFKPENTAKFDQAGLVGMLNFGGNTNGSQFFITYAAQPNLDGKYTVFGQVTQGMDVLEKLTPRNPAGYGTPKPGDKILSVTVEEK